MANVRTNRSTMYQAGKAIQRVTPLWVDELNSFTMDELLTTIAFPHSLQSNEAPIRLTAQRDYVINNSFLTRSLVPAKNQHLQRFTYRLSLARGHLSNALARDLTDQTLRAPKISAHGIQEVLAVQNPPRNTSNGICSTWGTRYVAESNLSGG